jgi:hypothetical protein
MKILKTIEDLTETEIFLIKEMAKAGSHTKTICDKYGCTDATARQICKRRIVQEHPQTRREEVGIKNTLQKKQFWDKLQNMKKIKIKYRGKVIRGEILYINYNFVTIVETKKYNITFGEFVNGDMEVVERGLK